ncbi:HAD family hydrolase [Streptomyces sp. P38-E01]|uniref:HAD family hydrolase n=1 Tax=Streptomyces tardus TaxID=2780544 RepID=A0A949JCW1_9ACTN|nr:HAD family hydrolase [Streptomyces tardus]
MMTVTRLPVTHRVQRLPRLIATDLDGTLLHDDKSVSARTVAALAAAERAGVEVFFVTGRPARWMDVVSEHVHGHGLAICANGAAVVDLHAGRSLVKVRELPVPTAREVVAALRSAAPGATFALERTSGMTYEPQYTPYFHGDDGPVATAPIDKLLASDAPVGQHDGQPGGGQCGDPVLKLLVRHAELSPDGFLELARAVAGDLAEITRSSPTTLLEISGRGVSKASTLAQCCAERGIEPEDVIAFGDMPNDLEMLNWAGRSYAMSNAHPAVLAATSHRTVGNNEDGVAAVIERLLAADLPR